MAQPQTLHLFDMRVPLLPTRAGSCNETIEERCFAAALVCLEGHYSSAPPMGPQTSARVAAMVSKTLEKTHASKQVRCVSSCRPVVLLSRCPSSRMTADC